MATERLVACKDCKYCKDLLFQTPGGTITPFENNKTTPYRPGPQQCEYPKAFHPYTGQWLPTNYARRPLSVFNPDGHCPHFKEVADGN